MPRLDGAPAAGEAAAVTNPMAGSAVEAGNRDENFGLLGVGGEPGERAAAPRSPEVAERPQRRGMSWERGALTMMAEVVGTGVLGLAYAGARVGWCLSLSFLFFFGACSLWSSLLLARVHEAHPRVDSYGAAAALFFGERARSLTALAVNANWLLVLPYYLMASSNALAVAFWWTDFCYWEWALASLVPLGLLAQIRSLEALSALSSASVLAIVVVLGGVVAALVSGGRDLDGSSTSFWPPAGMTLWDAFDSASAMTFAYQGQSMLFEIASEMEDGRDFGKAVRASGCGLGAVYAVAMGAGYYYRGGAVPAFLPDALADSWLKTALGAILYYHVIVTYLVNNQPLTRKIVNALWPADAHTREKRDNDGRPAEPPGIRSKWALVTGAFLAWAFLIANLIPWFSDFQNIMGSMLGAPIMFAFPVAFYVADPKQAPAIAANVSTRISLAVVGGVVLPLTWIIGSVAAVVGLVDDWATAGGAFQCAPSGYS